MPGEADWLARGLPRAGEKEGEPRAFDLLVDDPVTCALDPRLTAEAVMEPGPECRTRTGRRCG